MSADGLAGFVSGGEVVAVMPTDTTKNTGATTSAASARRRLVAVPLRTRRNDTIAGMIATKHSSIPHGATTGMIAMARHWLDELRSQRTSAPPDSRPERTNIIASESSAEET